MKQVTVVLYSLNKMTQFSYSLWSIWSNYLSKPRLIIYKYMSLTFLQFGIHIWPKHLKTWIQVHKALSQELWVVFEKIMWTLLDFSLLVGVQKLFPIYFVSFLGHKMSKEEGGVQEEKGLWAKAALVVLLNYLWC